MNVVKPGRRMCRAIAAAALATAASLACAPAGAADMNAVNHPGSIASSVMVGSAAPSLGIGAVLQTLVGLAVVIGLVSRAHGSPAASASSPRGAAAR